MPFGSGYEAASASKLCRAEASIVGLMSQNDAFWEACMTCIGPLQDLLRFCNITFPFLMVPERSFQYERNMTGPALS